MSGRNRRVGRRSMRWWGAWRWPHDRALGGRVCGGVCGVGSGRVGGVGVLPSAVRPGDAHIRGTGGMEGSGWAHVGTARVYGGNDLSHGRVVGAVSRIYGVTGESRVVSSVVG